LETKDTDWYFITGIPIVDDPVRIKTLDKSLLKGLYLAIFSFDSILIKS